MNDENRGAMEPLPTTYAGALPLITELFRSHTEQLDELWASLFTVTHVAPAKPREPMLRIADGTDWDPGSGAGLYLYLGGSWTKL